MERTPQNLRRLGIALVLMLLLAPLLALLVFARLYVGDDALYKESSTLSPLLTAVGRHGFEIKIASGIIYVLAWLLTTTVLLQSRAKQ